MGQKKHINIITVDNDPSYHPRGAGFFMLKRIMDKADRDRVLCWLTGSFAPREIYKEGPSQGVESKLIDSKKYDREILEKVKGTASYHPYHTMREPA